MSELYTATDEVTYSDGDMLSGRRAGALNTGLRKYLLSNLATYFAGKIFGSFAGEAGKVPTVNGGETGFIWGTGGGGGGGGAPPGSLELLSETITSGSQADVTFSSISADYTDLEIRVRARGTTAATFAALLLQFNGDTAANYDHVSAASNAAAGTAFEGAVAATSILIANIPASTAPATTVGFCAIQIGDYTGTTFHKACIGQASYKLANTTTGMNQQTTGGTWRSAAAINAVKVLLSAGNFEDGSIVSLYGRRSNTSGAPLEPLILSVSDETTALTAGTAKLTFRMPYAFTVTSIKASLSVAQATSGGGGLVTVDINEAGASILSTKLTIDNTEKTSVTAATPVVISDAVLADDAEITVDIDTVGDGTAKGLKLYMIGHR